MTHKIIWGEESKSQKPIYKIINSFKNSKVCISTKNEGKEWMVGKMRLERLIWERLRENKQQFLMTRLRGKGGRKTKKRVLEPGEWENRGPINLFGTVRGANVEKKVVLDFRLIEFDTRGQSRGKK